MSGDQSQQELRGRMCRCAACGETFGSPAAFDMHQPSGGERAPCIPASEFHLPPGKGSKPRLVMHPERGVWVTALNRRYKDGE